MKNLLRGAKGGPFPPGMVPLSRVMGLTREQIMEGVQNRVVTYKVNQNNIECVNFKEVDRWRAIVESRQTHYVRNDEIIPVEPPPPTGLDHIFPVIPIPSASKSPAQTPPVQTKTVRSPAAKPDVASRIASVPVTVAGMPWYTGNFDENPPVNPIFDEFAQYVLKQHPTARVLGVMTRVAFDAWVTEMDFGMFQKWNPDPTTLTKVHPRTNHVLIFASMRCHWKDKQIGNIMPATFMEVHFAAMFESRFLVKFTSLNMFAIRFMFRQGDDYLVSNNDIDAAMQVLSLRPARAPGFLVGDTQNDSVRVHLAEWWGNYAEDVVRERTRIRKEQEEAERRYWASPEGQAELRRQEENARQEAEERAENKRQQEIDRAEKNRQQEIEDYYTEISNLHARIAFENRHYGVSSARRIEEWRGKLTIIESKLRSLGA